MSSPTKPTTCIEDLPPEMISELFEHLPPKDLIACSMVNTRWQSIHAAFKLHRLAAIDRDRERIKWYGSNRPIQEAERCGPATFLRLVEKPLLSNLKQLALNCDLDFDLNELNRFRQLVHLEINIDLAGKVHLNLPKLKVLAFHDFNFDCALSIDCPELNTLLYLAETEYAHLLNVKHPETIRRLETNPVGQQLTRFKSVECLVIYEFEAISKATLLSLPALRELRYEQSIMELVYDEFNNEFGTIDRVKRKLSKFLDEAKKLRGSDFRFTFAGLQLTNVKADQIDFGLKVNKHGEWVSNEYIYMKNYHLIEPDALHFVRLIDYTDLLSHTTGEIPRCFFQKFTVINELLIHSVVKDPDHLLWFLKSLRSLRRLTFEDVKLSQEFYDQLPAVAPSLLDLQMSGQCWNDERPLNFDFIAQLSLSEIRIFPDLPLRSATSLVRWLGKLERALIRFRSGRDFWIKKDRGSPLWKVQDKFTPDSPTDRTLFETENADELVIFFAGVQTAHPETSI